MEDYKPMTYEAFLSYIDKICQKLEVYINDNKIKVDYICPVLRSGAIPAIYISNRLNIIKFLPMQVKHIAYNDGTNNIEMIFNPLNCVEIKKEEPVFLVVEAMHSTGTSVKICIDEIKKRYKNARILYVCLTKEYRSENFENLVEYEDTGFFYNGKNKLDEEKCKELQIEYFTPLFPWEILENELQHPDDLEENIFF